jgi:hypothetical protein
MTNPSSADERALFEAADLMTHGETESSAQYRSKQDRLVGWMMARASLGAAQVPSLSTGYANDDQQTTMLGVIAMLEKIEKGEVQTSPPAGNPMFGKTRARAATITDAKRVLSYALPQLRSLNAALSQPSQQEAK